MRRRAWRTDSSSSTNRRVNRSAASTPGSPPAVPAAVGVSPPWNRSAYLVMAPSPDRQSQHERRPPAGGVLHVDRSPVPGDDVVRHGQPQPLPLPDVPRGEERFEDASPEVGGHPGAVVGEGDADPVPRYAGADRHPQLLLPRLEGVPKQAEEQLVERPRTA